MDLKKEAKRDRSSGGGKFISKAVFQGGGVNWELPRFPGLWGSHVAVSLVLLTDCCLSLARDDVPPRWTRDRVLFFYPPCLNRKF